MKKQQVIHPVIVSGNIVAYLEKWWLRGRLLTIRVFTGIPALTLRSFMLTRKLLFMLFPCMLTGMLYGQQTPRIGVQSGASIESAVFRTVVGGEETRDLTTGMTGLCIHLPLSTALFLDLSPYYAQRNHAFTVLGKHQHSTVLYQAAIIDRLGLPILIGYTPFHGQLVSPYLAAGLEFGMNVSAAPVRITEFLYSMETAQESIREHSLSVTQLFSAAVVEAGFHVRSGTPLSALLAARYSHEFAPLIEARLYRHSVQESWIIRFGLMYEFSR
jgi:hypothetical protein